MIRGVNHIGINTSNLDGLAAFYNEVLGFGDAASEVSWRNHPGLDAVLGLTGSAARQRMLRAGNCYLELFEFSAPAAQVQPPLRACDRGITHLALDVENIDQEVARLRALGMRFLSDAPIIMGSLRAIYGLDPDGNLIELIQPAPEHPYSLGQLSGPSTLAIVIQRTS